MNLKQKTANGERRTVNHPAFTLIELLIVISIIGILATLVINNLNDARARARDLKRKAELRSLKQALRMYYNDYQHFPDSQFGLIIKGCGPNGDENCPYSGCNADFTAGGTDGCQTTYMQHFTPNGSYYFFRYYACSGNDNYVLKTTLENASDSDIQTSQDKCPNTCGTTYSSTDYVLCPD